MAKRITFSELLVGLAVLALLYVAVRGCNTAPHVSAFRASWTLTPGVANPEVTAATIRSTICTRGWTRTIRPPTSYTDELKVRQMHEYGFRGSTAQYQEDHLISLELGGHPTDPRNLWPERRPRADDVDSIENDLNAKICDGSLSLQDAQRKIAEIKHTAG